MKNTDKLWEENINNSLNDLANIDLQHSSWMGTNNNYISSFTEVLGMLYDSFGFEDYIEYYREHYGQNNIYDNLVQLDKMINDYQEIGYELEAQGDIEKILLDFRWIKITEKAKEVLGLMQNESGTETEV